MSWSRFRDRSKDKTTEYREEAAQAAAKLMVLENQPSDFRTEATVRVSETGVVEANTPSTAIPSLILLDPHDKYTPSTQAIVIREDPIARYCVDRIAEIVYDDGFKLVKRGTDEEHEYNQPIQDELIRMNGKQLLTRWYAANRGYGHAWLDVIPANNEDYREDDSGNQLQPKIAKIDVYTPLFTEVVSWDDRGNPKDLEITVTQPDGTKGQTPIKASDCILMRTRPFGDRSFRGLSVLTDIWDALTYIRQVLFSMGWYSIKVGIGVFYVKIRGAVTKEKVAAAKAVLTGLSTKRGIIYSDLVVDEFGFIQAQAGATDFTAYIDTLLSQVAAGTGIPKTIFVGMAESSLGGADVSVDLQVSVINTEQQKQEYYLRELFFRMGFENTDYDFEWPTRSATSEEQKSKILMNNAQADAISCETTMTINEVRERRSLEPKDGGDELLKLRDTNKMDFNFQTSDEKEQTQNPKGENV